MNSVGLMTKDILKVESGNLFIFIELYFPEISWYYAHYSIMCYTPCRFST